VTFSALKIPASTTVPPASSVNDAAAVVAAGVG